MPRVCTVCAHTDCFAINRLLAAGESANRRIASQYGLSEAAIRRHKDGHIPVAMVTAQHIRAEENALNVMDELKRCFTRVNLLFDACDDWLRDADDPTKYDIGPRAEELMVTYIEMFEGKRVRRKSSLSHLLGRLEGSGMSIEGWETKRADPRDLVLKTADRLRQQTELLAKLLGELSDQPQINVLVAPEWLQVRAALLDALAAYPEARTAVAERLLVLEARK
jgi:hypothetical protein